ncbi:MAG: hypothetical protein WDZ82_00985 [Candidatus Paceibacterota bacterium]
MLNPSLLFVLIKQISKGCEMPRKIKQWFVEPIGSHGNSLIANLLGDDRTREDIVGPRGYRPKLYECTREEVTSITQSDIYVRVWKQYSNDQLVRDTGLSREPKDTADV